VIAAALVMFSVFASYVLQAGTSIEEFGFTVAVAIPVDAFIARMIASPR
jgi:putative drug exporter of the RND superfamily